MEKLIENMPPQTKWPNDHADFRKWWGQSKSPQDLTKVNAEVADAIDKYDFGGVILLLKTSKKPDFWLWADYKKAKDWKQSQQWQNHFVVLSTTGGIVYRLGTGTAPFPVIWPMDTNDPKLAKEAGQSIWTWTFCTVLECDFARLDTFNNN